VLRKAAMFCIQMYLGNGTSGVGELTSRGSGYEARWLMPNAGSHRLRSLAFAFICICICICSGRTTVVVSVNGLRMLLVTLLASIRWRHPPTRTRVEVECYESVVRTDPVGLRRVLPRPAEGDAGRS